MSITFSTCFYIIKCKFEPTVYIQWMDQFFSMVNKNFNLVVFTDEHTSQYILPKVKNNPRIRVVIKPLSAFHHYQYKEKWIKNHEKNVLLNGKIDWEVNMLWSEKIWFVKDAIENRYFAAKTDFYGWCDIGYFRNRQCDMNTDLLLQNSWPNPDVIAALNPDKIHYSCVNNDIRYMAALSQFVKNKNAVGLPATEIPPDQMSVAGGFFILHKKRIDWWAKTYDAKLNLYFKHDYLVKDDQMIVIDCILSDDRLESFQLYKESIPWYDNWFMFQRILN